MATRLADGLFLVVNAARKEADLAHLRDRLGTSASIEPLADRALLALQGPAAATVLSRFVEGIARLRFMSAAEVTIGGRQCLVTRSGYTGEDGFEISLPAGEAEGFARRLIAEPEVLPIGLGARDSLRLEAGLCLYGHDIDETTTPIEADLAWTIGKRRRAEGGFPGAATILASARRRNAPQARRHPSGRARAGARRHRDCRRRREQAGESDERRLRPLGRGAGRNGLCRFRRMPRRARRCSSWCAALRGRRGSSGCRSFRPAITAADAHGADRDGKRRASFETAASQLPQDEESFLMPQGSPHAEERPCGRVSKHAPHRYSLVSRRLAGGIYR